MKNKSSFLGVVVLVLLIGGTIYSLFIRPQFFNFNGGEAILAPVEQYQVSDDFVEMNMTKEYIFECNKNGLVMKNIEGESIWSKSFFIEDPLMEINGDYVAVADITGKSVYVFNTDGFIREIKESYPIINIHINKEGFLSVVQEKDTQNLIHYYNNKGVQVVKRTTRFFENGYPIDIVTSDDVSKMVTGYLNVSNNRLQTKISFFGFDDEYDEYEENLIGGFTYENTLLSDLYWIKDNKTLAVMDNQILLYLCEKEPEVIRNIPVHAEINNVIITSEHIVVWYGKAIDEGDHNQNDQVIVYDFDGEEVDRQLFEDRIVGISMANEGHYVLTTAQIIKYNGSKTIWFADTYLEIEEFYEVNKEEFVVFTGRGYEILKMRNQ